MSRTVLHILSRVKLVVAVALSSLTVGSVQAGPALPYSVAPIVIPKYEHMNPITIFGLNNKGVVAGLSPSNDLMSWGLLLRFDHGKILLQEDAGVQDGVDINDNGVMLYRRNQGDGGLSHNYLAYSGWYDNIELQSFEATTYAFNNALDSIGYSPYYGRRWVTDEFGDIYPGNIEYMDLSFINVNGSTYLFDLSIRPSGLNEVGQVVGWSSSKAFLFQNGQLQYLNIPGTAFSMALDINDDGLIVGYSSKGAFFYKDGSVTYLNGNINGDLMLNNRGEFIGRNFSFLYSGGSLYSLTSLVADTLGYTEFTALDLNDSGQILASAYHPLKGYGWVLLNPNGLSVPEPSSLVAMALGGLALLGAGLRRHVCSRRAG